MHEDESAKLLPIRFSPKANNYLRPRGSKRGDLARRMFEAIEGVDWTQVAVEDRPRTPYKGKDYVVTTVKIPEKLHHDLKEAAAKRGISISALIDGCVRAHFGPQ